MRRFLSFKVLLATVGVVALAILGYSLWPRPSAEDLGDLRTRRVTLGGIGRMAYVSGTIKPLVTRKVASSVGAKIKKILVKDGDLVAKGQILIQLDEDELTAKLAKARAQYLRTLSLLREIQNWHSSPSFIEARSGLETHQMDFESKQREYEQNQQLYKAKAIARQDLDRSKNEMERARVELEKARAQLAQSRIKGGPDALKEGEANFTAAKLGLREAQEALAHKDIRSPVAGVLRFSQPNLGGGGGKMGSMPKGESTLTENSSVSPGQVLFHIESHEHLGVEVFIQESDALLIKPDHPCFFSLAAHPETSFPGLVESVSVDIQDKFSRFIAKCRIVQPDTTFEDLHSPGNAENDGTKRPKLPIKVGMMANIAIPLEKKTDVLLVPVTALVKEGGRTGVFLMNKGKPVFHEVKVGIVNQDEAEITEGLQEGQVVLTEVPGKLLKKVFGSSDG
jgi:multidrug efflux pump subunit AcrA (membrane-fusion protein)